MRPDKHLLLIVALAALFVSNLQAATLTHRYSFDIDANDLVGSANGTLSGNAYLTNGNLILDGTNSYVSLPNDLFTNYTSISFEIWYHDEGVNSLNAQLYSFSGPNGGMNYSLFGQGAYLPASILKTVYLATPAVGRTNHIVWTQDSVSKIARIYVNGVYVPGVYVLDVGAAGYFSRNIVGENTNFTATPMSIGSTTTNRIGAGLTSTNNFNFKGSILEFRTYEGALALLDVAVLDAFGPDHPQTNPGTPQAVRLVTPSTTGPGAVFRAGVFADFSAVTNVNISIQPDLVLTSDNTNVIAIAPDNRLQTLTLGAANITAMWQGFSNTVALTVGVPQDIALIHRFGFNEQTNDWIMHDSVGEAPGMLFNTGAHAPTNAVFTGNGEMNLSGGFSYYRGGYATLPPRIISSLSEVSIEAWVTWTRPLDALVHYEWQRIFDFGTFIGSTPQSYLFLTPSSNNHLQTTNYAFYFAITTNSLQAEKPRLVWTNTLPLNVTSFLAVTYSPIRGLAKMYLNGALVASDVATIPLSGIIDNNNCLGRSQWSNDPNFGGRYNEFRIYSGLLSDADVAADYAAGPDVVGVDYVLHNYYVPTNSLTITWGLSATNWYLESSPSLGPGAVWNPVPITPLQNGRNNVTVPVSGDAAFFRLHAP